MSSVASNGRSGGAGSPTLVLTPQEKGRAGGGGWPERGELAPEDRENRPQVLAPEDQGQGKDQGQGQGQGHDHGLVLTATIFAENRN